MCARSQIVPCPPPLRDIHTQQTCNAPSYEDTKVEAQMILLAEDYRASSLDLL